MMQYEYLATHDDCLQKAMFAKDKWKFLLKWHNCHEKIDCEINLNQFGFILESSALDQLPQLSFILRIPFKLKKPYLSKSDRAFHLLENPIKRDKVFQTPMVAPTSWKGSLRAALWNMGHQEEDEKIIRLFGIARDDDRGQSGCLYFYPTFFDKIGLEVINPHDRKTGVGKNPILIESVPIGAKGSFVLLYVPFGRVSATQVAKDLELVAEGVKEMLTVYGFGAKTSSGFGVVEDQAEGQIVIKYPYYPERSQRPKEPEYPEILRLFLQQYPGEEFQLKPEAWRTLHKASQSQRNNYRDARHEYLTYQNQLKDYEAELMKLENEPNAPPLPIIEKEFSTLDEMIIKANQIAKYLPINNGINHDS